MGFLLFDIEGVVDEKRVLRTERPTRGWVDPRGQFWSQKESNTTPETDEEMVARVIQGICDRDPAVKAGDRDCFPPARFHAPTTICMLLVDDNLRYVGHQAIAREAGNFLKPKELFPDFRANVETFWQFYAAARQLDPNCCLVTFSGHSYDLPVLEIGALEYGIALPAWFQFDVPSYADPRSQWSQKFHLDLSQYLSKGKGGSLSYYSRLLGLPGKMDTKGGMVADMLKKDGGRKKVIDYCWCDTLNTYGVFFETLRAAGKVPAGYRKNPIFEDTMNKVIADLGPEAQAFKLAYEQSLIDAPF